jgi:hypothetical protein
VEAGTVMVGSCGVEAGTVMVGSCGVDAGTVMVGSCGVEHGTVMVGSCGVEAGTVMVGSCGAYATSMEFLSKKISKPRPMPPMRFELMTAGLRDQRSTTELKRQQLLYLLLQLHHYFNFPSQPPSTHSIHPSPCIAQYRICSKNYAPIKNKLSSLPCISPSGSFVDLLSLHFIHSRCNLFDDGDCRP